MKSAFLAVIGAVAFASSMFPGEATASPVKNGTASYYLNDGFPEIDLLQVHGVSGHTKENLPASTGVLMDYESEVQAVWQGNVNINAGAGFASIQGPSLGKGRFGNYGSIDFTLGEDYAFRGLLVDLQQAFDTSLHAAIADKIIVTTWFSNGTVSAYDGWLGDTGWGKGHASINRLMVLADDGYFITHVMIESFAKESLVNGIFQTKHYQVAGPRDCGPAGACSGESTTPVSLPDSFALMLGGIALFGCLATRRSTQADHPEAKEAAVSSET